MKFYKYILFIACSFLVLFTQAQKTLNEGTLIYNISVETGSAEPKMADMLDSAYFELIVYYFPVVLY